MTAGIDLAALTAGNRRALAKAITLIESSHPEHKKQAQQLLENLLPLTGKSIRIGISGTPGVGKSTFIEVFGLLLIGLGKKVAVLAIDPSSPVAGGSILGDKTRMELLSREANAFIRPSPSSGQLGGVALKTRESMLACEAAGFDVIVVETVGAGQSEFDVVNMVDFFLVLLQPNAGDDLQGIKKGIIEMADALVINKADGDSLAFAQQAQQYSQNALTLVSRKRGWQVPVLTCSAREKRDIDTVWKAIEAYYHHATELGDIKHKRAEQNVTWMKKLFAELLEARMHNQPQFLTLRTQLQNQVAAGQISPALAAQQLLSLI
jgi:LAO/AO transport system kinase